MYEFNNIAFHDIAVHGDTGWFFNIGYNAIMKINIKTGVTNIESFLPDYNWGDEELYASIEYFDEKIYLAPRNGKRLCIYSLKDKNYTFVEIDLERYGEKENFNLFNSVKEIDGKIYFFPGRFHKIIALNPNDLSVEYVSYGYGDLSKQWNQKQSGLLITNRVHIKGSRCIMPCWRANLIVDIDLKTRTYKIIRVDYSAKLADADYFDGDYICTFKDNDEVLFLDGDTLTPKSVLSLSGDKAFWINIYGKTCLLMPLFGNAIKQFNIENNLLNTIYSFPTKTDYKCVWNKYKNTFLCNKALNNEVNILYSCRDGMLLYIYPDGISRKIRIILDDDSKCLVNSEKKNKFANILYGENERYRLSDFLNDLIEL